MEYKEAAKLVQDPNLFLVGEFYMIRLQAEFDKFTKKANKLKVTAPSFTVLENILHEDKKRKRVYEFNLVKVVGETPKLKGWEFIGAISHLPTDDGMKKAEHLRNAPGKEIPQRFRGRQICDHCKTKRRRNDTFIVKKTTTGDHKQVGRQCVTSYLGGVDPKVFTQYIEFWDAMWSIPVGDEDNPGNRGLLPLSTFIAYSIASTEEDGWVSRGKSYESGEQSTADSAGYWMTAKRPHEKSEALKDWEAHQPDKAQFNMASKVIDWVNEMDTKGNDYLTNLQSISFASGLDGKSIGLAASMFSAYNRANNKVSDGSKSDHVGKIGERVTLKLKLEKVFPTQGFYGPSFVHTFTDGTNKFTWFSNKKSGFAVGKEIEVKGTVKKHDMYRGEKKTILNRVSEVKK